MSRSKKNKKNNPHKPTEPDESPESEFLTTGWVLVVLTGFVCDLGAGLTRLFADPESEGVAVLAGFLLFAAAVLGAISLLLLAAVIRVRREPAPRGFVIFAVIVAVSPLLGMVAALVRSG